MFLRNLSSFCSSSIAWSSIFILFYSMLILVYEWELLIQGLCWNLLGLEILQDRLVHLDLFICIGKFFLCALEILRRLVRLRYRKGPVGRLASLLADLLGQLIILPFQSLNQLPVDLRQFLYLVFPSYQNAYLSKPSLSSCLGEVSEGIYPKLLFAELKLFFFFFSVCTLTYIIDHWVKL